MAFDSPQKVWVKVKWEFLDPFLYFFQFISFLFSLQPNNGFSTMCSSSLEFNALSTSDAAADDDITLLWWTYINTNVLCLSLTSLWCRHILFHFLGLFCFGGNLQSKPSSKSVSQPASQSVSEWMLIIKIEVYKNKTHIYTSHHSSFIR